MRIGLFAIPTAEQLEQIYQNGARIEAARGTRLAAQEAAKERALKAETDARKRRLREALRVERKSAPPLAVRLRTFKAAKRKAERQQAERDRQVAEAERAQARRTALAVLKANAWPMEKQRRSNIDWHALLSPAMAVAQIKYEREATVVAMRASGMSLRMIGIKFGLTPERIRQMADSGLRKCASAYQAPAEWAINMSKQEKMTFRRPKANAVLSNIARLPKPPIQRDWLIV